MPLETKGIEAGSVFSCPSCRKQLRARGVVSPFMRVLAIAEGMGAFYAGHIFKLRWLEQIGAPLAAVGGFAHLLRRKGTLVIEPADQSIDINKRRPTME
jgi:hypothetical protein